MAASELEKIMDEFESALAAVLSASYEDRNELTLDVKKRLAEARKHVKRALTTRSGAENEYRAAVDRAFGTARQNFR